MAGLRIAFLTPEFVTEQRGGGLANYLNRMTQVLHDAGHRPEIFVSSTHPPGTIDHGGIPVHRVGYADHLPLFRFLWTLHALYPRRHVNEIIRRLSAAKALALALEEVERAKPFDLVQSADYLGCGYFVGKRADRPRVIRCSSASRLCADIENDRSPVRRWLVRLEERSLRRSEILYAPSRYTADYYSAKIGRSVAVVRPPCFEERVQPLPAPVDLPPRYLLHFGQMRILKGSDWLTESLPLAWKQCPDLRMVWVGSAEKPDLDRWRKAWGTHAAHITLLTPQPKGVIYSILRGSMATVLPSLVDNLPNTVIESLMCGIPVIGTAGASIDELVEQDVTGELVPMRDASALAAAMVKVWRGQSRVRKGFAWDSTIRREMEPARAVESWLKQVRQTPVHGGS